MAMIEKGMGISIRVPYKIEIRPLKEPYYRSIGLAMKNRKNLTPAVQRFIEYLPFRETE